MKDNDPVVAARLQLIRNFKRNLKYVKKLPKGFLTYLTHVIEHFGPQLGHQCCWASQAKIADGLDTKEVTVYRYTRISKQLGIFTILAKSKTDLQAEFPQIKWQNTHRLNIHTFSDHWLWSSEHATDAQKIDLVKAVKELSKQSRGNKDEPLHEEPARHRPTPTPCRGSNPKTDPYTGVGTDPYTGVGQKRYLKKEASGLASFFRKEKPPLPAEEQQPAISQQEGGMGEVIDSCEDQGERDLLEFRKKRQEQEAEIATIITSLETQYGMAPSRTYLSATLASKIYVLLRQQTQDYPHILDGKHLVISYVAVVLERTLQDQQWEGLNCFSWGWLLSAGREDSDRVSPVSRFTASIRDACDAHYWHAVHPALQAARDADPVYIAAREAKLDALRAAAQAQQDSLLQLAVSRRECFNEAV